MKRLGPRAMINPVGGISMLDGLAALTRVGVVDRAYAGREVWAVQPTRRREDDTVELSPQAYEQIAAHATSVERETFSEMRGSLIDVMA